MNDAILTLISEAAEYAGPEDDMNAAIWEAIDAAQEAIKQPPPQVYVSVSGGIAEVWVARGNVDIVDMDWDQYNSNGFEDYTFDDLILDRNDLERIADPDYREVALDSIDEIIEQLYDTIETDAVHDEVTRNNALERARKLLREAGEL